MMYVCDHRYRRLLTLRGPVQLVCKLNHGPDPSCPGHAETKSPELEVTIALPKWASGWDVLCWIGHRRYSRHWSVTQIRAELQDEYGIRLSEDSIARYIPHYQVMLAARQQDPETLRRQYESVAEIILSIDGLQPEEGHETLSVVRELTQKRVWFAEALISATADEVRRLSVAYGPSTTGIPIRCCTAGACWIWPAPGWDRHGKPPGSSGPPRHDHPGVRGGRPARTGPLPSRA